MLLIKIIFILQKTRNKAVGETIILFHYLFESCSARIWLWNSPPQYCHLLFYIQRIIYYGLIYFRYLLYAI